MAATVTIIQPLSEEAISQEPCFGIASVPGPRATGAAIPCGYMPAFVQICGVNSAFMQIHPDNRPTLAGDAYTAEELLSAGHAGTKLPGTRVIKPQCAQVISGTSAVVANPTVTVSAALGEDAAVGEIDSLNYEVNPAFNLEEGETCGFFLAKTFFPSAAPMLVYFCR